MRVNHIYLFIVHEGIIGQFPKPYPLSLSVHNHQEFPGCARHHGSRCTNFPSSTRPGDCCDDFRLCGAP